MKIGADGKPAELERTKPRGGPEKEAKLSFKKSWSIGISTNGRP